MMRIIRVIEFPVIAEDGKEYDARIELCDMGVIEIFVDGKRFLTCDWQNNFEKVVVQILKEWMK